MRYLAVPEMPRRGWLDRLLRWGERKPKWHAVVESRRGPTKALCGSAVTSEAHRTWDQTESKGRCRTCERLVPVPPVSSGDPQPISSEKKRSVIVSRRHGYALRGLVGVCILILTGVSLSLVSGHSSTPHGLGVRVAPTISPGEPIEIPPVAAIEASPPTTIVSANDPSTTILARLRQLVLQSQGDQPAIPATLDSSAPLPSGVESLKSTTITDSSPTTRPTVTIAQAPPPTPVTTGTTAPTRVTTTTTSSTTTTSTPTATTTTAPSPTTTTTTTSTPTPPTTTTTSPTTTTTSTTTTRPGS